MKAYVIAGLLCLSRAALAAGPAPAWCKGAPTPRFEMADLSSKDIRTVLTAYVSATCAPTEAVSDQYADVEKGRQAWTRRLGMTEADWGDVVEYVKAGNDYSIDVPVVAKDLADATPLDQYAIIRGAENNHAKYDTFYAADMFEGKTSQAARYAFLTGTCFDQSKSVATDGTGLIGSEVTWAICQPDFDQFDLAKYLAEIKADTTHGGAARVALRVGAYDWAKRAQAHAEQVKAMLAADPGNQKLFEVAKNAREAWAGSVGKHGALLELVLAMESATRTQSRKQFDGCAERTSKALADAVSTIPARRFAQIFDDIQNPWQGFAAKAGIVLGQSAPVNLAAIATSLCTPDSPTGKYLKAILAYAPAMRGPRSAAAGRLRDEKIEYDNVKAKLRYPEPRPYGEMYPEAPVHALSYTGTVKKVSRAGDVLTIEREQVLIAQPTCLKFHATGRVSYIHDNGRVEYERICDQPGTTQVNQASTPLTVNAKFEPLLKRGVMISISGDDVIAVWPSKSAKLPSLVLGGAVK